MGTYSMNFYYYDQPQVTKILPMTGSVDGGNEVSLIGAGFQPINGISELIDTEYAKCDFQGVGVTQA